LLHLKMAVPSSISSKISNLLLRIRFAPASLKEMRYLILFLLLFQSPGWCGEGNATSGMILPTHTKVAYGPDPMQFVNVWLAKSEAPTPVLVMIHGGGWCGGNVDEVLKEEGYLSRGISVVSVEYRRTPGSPLPAPVMDAARAVQFIRSKAGEWNLDKTKLALLGGSAGACTSLWLAFHDDLADPDSEDPVSRESTKPLCVVASNAQTSIDPPVIREWIGEEVLKHGMIFLAAGEPDTAAMLANYEKHKPLYEKFSPVNHLDASDPPAFLVYGGATKLPAENAGQAIHHPAFGLRLRRRQ